MDAAQRIIEHFGMKPLEPEGGYFVETYRCGRQLEVAGFTGPRSLASSILYLLTAETFSAMHRLDSDEIWHFLLGDPVEMLLLGPDGRGRLMTLGPDITAGHQIQIVAGAGTYQGCRLADDGRYALMATTVTPGFDFKDFHLAQRVELLADYPDHAEPINRLTRAE